MDQPVRVFISSTWHDLRPEREAVEATLRRSRAVLYVSMADFGSRPGSAQDVSLDEVSRCQIYLGIFARRYGSGITEAEYRRAIELGRPCLVYFKDDAVPVRPEYVEDEPASLTALERLKQELLRRHLVSRFSSPEHLAAQAVADLTNLLSQLVPLGRSEHVPVEHVQVPSPRREAWSFDVARLEQLADHVRQDDELLKSYEDALRYESDPRRKLGYEREIRQLRQTVAERRQELEVLQVASGVVPAIPSPSGAVPRHDALPER